jgi:hypothetical protein
MLFAHRKTAKRLQSVCSQLLDATREVDEWRWDDQFGAALLTIESVQERPVLTRLQQIFPDSWDQLDVSRAPEHVRHVAGVWGGLMAGQHLLVRDAAADPLIYALWMPWSNRLRTSVRVSCAAFDEAVARHDPRDGLRDCMGLAGE